MTLHLCNLVCNVVSNKMLEIDLDVVATKSCKKDCFTRVFFLCLHVSSVAFRFHLLLAEFPQWVLIYFLQCYAPARLTRVIAQQMKSHRDVPLMATFLSVFNCHETVIDCFRDFDCLSLSLSQVLGLPRSTTASLKLRMASTMLFNMSCTSFG